MTIPRDVGFKMYEDTRKVTGICRCCSCSFYGEIMYDDEMIRLQFALCAIKVGGAEEIRGPWHSNCNRKAADWDEVADGRDTKDGHTKTGRRMLSTRRYRVNPNAQVRLVRSSGVAMWANVSIRLSRLILAEYNRLILVEYRLPCFRTASLRSTVINR